jgi:hypothetical protein
MVVRDGWIYFGQGSATNSGIVGEDDFAFGWPDRAPEFHDLPCRDVTLTGVNVRTLDPRTSGARDSVETGAYLPFGTASVPGLVVFGQIPCSGSILRLKARGGPPEVVAWGLRNPFGLSFDRKGTLYALDDAYDDRGSRPVRDAGDLLWVIRSGAWYGWPDYHGSHRLDSSDRFRSSGGDTLKPLIRNPPAPADPISTFAPHSTPTGIDFSTDRRFGYVGSAFVAEFGDLAPLTGDVPAPAGFKIVVLDPTTGVPSDFATNRGRSNGPASLSKGKGLERPIALRFSPDGTGLYVVDFGVITAGERVPQAQLGTGVLWRISRVAAPAATRPAPKRTAPASAPATRPAIPKSGKRPTR